MRTQYVTYQEYSTICRKHGEADPEQQSSLGGFLHDLGIALNYRYDPRLRFAYVLKPEWVTEGIYGLLHAFVTSKGCSLVMKPLKHCLTRGIYLRQRISSWD